MPTVPSFHVSRDRFHLAWDPAVPPVLEVGSGATVTLDLADASGGQLSPTSTAGDLANIDGSVVNPIVGPIKVAGSNPGDTLQIDLLAYTPGAYGWTCSTGQFGLLPDDFPEPHLRVSDLSDGALAEILPGVRVPIAPFCGELGVAPGVGPLPTIPPGLHGGNLDTRDLVAGATLFLPVFHPGALFSMGDGHAAQGDGEVCGSAIETEMTATVRLTARPDLHLDAPEFLAPERAIPERRTSTRYVTTGIGPDLLEATRAAVRRMIDWMGREHAIAPADAYLLCSVAVDLRLSEVVDMPNHVVTAHCPLSIFG